MVCVTENNLLTLTCNEIDLMGNIVAATVKLVSRLVIPNWMPTKYKTVTANSWLFQVQMILQEFK